MYVRYQVVLSVFASEAVSPLLDGFQTARRNLYHSNDGISLDCPLKPIVQLHIFLRRPPLLQLEDFLSIS